MEVSTDECYVPGAPPHGTYQRPGGMSDEGARSLVVKFSCDGGFVVSGPAVLYCEDGRWSDVFPSCVAMCPLEPHPSVEYRCLVTGGEGTRQCERQEPPGTVVNPLCRRPNYYAATDLYLMRCLPSGQWNYVATCTPECGKVTPVGVDLVVGGAPARRGELPWHAGIYRKTFQPYLQVCGGSLVSSHIVISAAHCFWDQSEALPASLFAVAVGKLYRPWNNKKDEAQKSDVLAIQMPPRFLGADANFQDDIAVLVVKDAFQFKTFIRPVCLSFDVDIERLQLPDETQGKVAGWGLTGANGNASAVLQVIDLPYVEVSTCIKNLPYSFREYITSDKICAGTTDNTTGLCKGDSGGGLAFPVWDRGAPRYFLHGVVSTAPNDGNYQCNTNYYTTFTQVRNHELFIKQFWSGADETESTPSQAPPPPLPVSVSQPAPEMEREMPSSFPIVRANPVRKPILREYNNHSRILDATGNDDDHSHVDRESVDDPQARTNVLSPPRVPSIDATPEKSGNFSKEKDPSVAGSVNEEDPTSDPSIAEDSFVDRDEINGVAEDDYSGFIANPGTNYGANPLTPYYPLLPITPELPYYPEHQNYPESLPNTDSPLNPLSRGSKPTPPPELPPIPGSPSQNNTSNLTLCAPSPCGPQSVCRVFAGHAVCACSQGATGSPPNCRSCTSDTECGSALACLLGDCLDPCSGSCGTGAICDVHDHVPSCSCRSGDTGDPFVACTSIAAVIPTRAPCSPSPCGRHSVCRAVHGHAACKCKEGYFGSPPQCRPCLFDNECGAKHACLNGTCTDPCHESCGEHATCSVRDHVPSCFCPQGFEGDPFVRCTVQPYISDRASHNTSLNRSRNNKTTLNNNNLGLNNKTTTWKTNTNNLNNNTSSNKKNTIDQRECGRLSKGTTPTTPRSWFTWVSPATTPEALPPWHVTIYRMHFAMHVVCAGALLSSRHFISAAHCFWDESTNSPLPASQFSVMVGSDSSEYGDYGEDQKQTSQVLTITLPGWYRGVAGPQNSNFAVVTLAAPLQLSEYVTPLCLAAGNGAGKIISHMLNGIVSGWGLAGGALDLSYRADVGWCGASAGTKSITSNTVCVDKNSTRALCGEDSGTAVAFPSGGRYYLHGVVTCGLTSTPGGVNYTTMPLQEGFIKQFIEKTSN